MDPSWKRRLLALTRRLVSAARKAASQATTTSVLALIASGLALLRVSVFLGAEALSAFAVPLLWTYVLLYGGRTLVHGALQHEYWSRKGLRLCLGLQGAITLGWLLLARGEYSTGTVMLGVVALTIAVCFEAEYSGQQVQRHGILSGSQRVRLLGGAGGVSVGEVLDGAVLPPVRVVDRVNSLIWGRVGGLILVVVAGTPLVLVSTGNRKEHPQVDTALTSTTDVSSEPATSVGALATAVPVALPASRAPSSASAAGVPPTDDLTSYEKLCGKFAPQPGDGAPRWAKQLLHDVVLGSGGVGGIVAGCTALAGTIGDGEDQVVFQQGLRDGRVVSVATVSRRMGAGIALGDAVRFVTEKLNRGEPVSVSPRWTLGTGDGYLLQEPTGFSVLLRQTLKGPAGPTAYTYLSPKLAPAWATAVRSAGHWLWPRRASEGLVLDDASGSAVGSVEEEGDRGVQVSLNRRRLRIVADLLDRLAPRLAELPTI